MNASATSTINWESTTLIKDVYSGYGDDKITGSFLDNIIYGGQGTDTISSLAGDYYIYVAHDGPGLRLFYVLHLGRVFFCTPERTLPENPAARSHVTASSPLYPFPLAAG